MKRIVFVVPMLAPYSIERFRELAKNPEIELHIIAEKDTYMERDASGWKFQNIDGCKTYLLGSKDLAHNVINRSAGYNQEGSRVYSFKLKKLVNSIDPDVVIVCNSTQLLFLLGRHKYKLGIVVEDTLRAEESRKALHRLVKRMLMKTADFLLPFNDEAIRFVKKNHLKNPSFKTTWSVDLELFNSLDSEEKVAQKKQAFGIGKKRNYTIVASLIPRKGILQFLDAWSLMGLDFQQRNDLNVIGDGPLKEKIQNFIAEKKLDNVRLMNSLPYKQIAEFLQCSDVFVLPTLEDVWGMVTMEAMASGLPVMTTIYAGSKELVEEGKNGYIFDSMDTESIRNTLLKMDASDLQAMKQQARNTIAAYSNQKVMAQLGDILLSKI